MNNNNATEISVDEWKIVLGAIPGASKAENPEIIKSHLDVVTCSELTPLSADGMYIVLEGAVKLILKGEHVATAEKADYFYEEHLVIDHLKVDLDAHANPGTKLLFLSSGSWTKLPESVRQECLGSMFGDLVNVHMHDFQQPVNCCNITAAALSLTALGFSSEVNDIFKNCALPVSYVVNDGLTLGELYDVACTYIHSRGLRKKVGVQAYNVDSDITSERDILDAVAESDRDGAEHDILVANFDVDIAHGGSKPSNGHFALLAKCNQSTGIVHMMDVHPEKYGKLWVTTIELLYKAMAVRDQDSGRARGLMRVFVRDEVDKRLEALDRHSISVNSTRHLKIKQDKRRNLFSRSSTNLDSLCVLSLGLAIAGDDFVSEDQLLSSADISHTDALSNETTAEELTRIANSYLKHENNSDLKCKYLSLDGADDKSISGDQWFQDRLLELGVNHDKHFLINIDFNKVVGFEAITTPEKQRTGFTVLEEFWCVCISYDPDSDRVTLADMSSATSQTWQTPRKHLFRGLREASNPALMVLERNLIDYSAMDLDKLVNNHAMVLFYSDDDPWSYMLKSILGNIGITELHTVDLTGGNSDTLKLRKQLVINSGKDKVPYLYFKGSCLGDTHDIVSMVKDGTLQQMVHDEGLPVLLRSETPSLDNNIYSYPKGGLTEAPNGKRNVLLAACGSSAADKIPELVELLVTAGHNVKLLPSVSAEIFFKDFGMKRIMENINASDIYRDDDEWNFRYTEYGMPVRAAHLALCDWADCMVVAPITCNTMGKAANGIADSILTSAFVAWQYQRKPIILCPACNTDMWHNITTQNNVESLRRLGSHIEGPRSGILSNGTIGVGMMATPSEILVALDTAFGDLDDQERRIMKWGKEAAASDDFLEWKRIFRAIDENVVGINIVADDTGDTLLHYAAGGEGEMHEHGLEKGVPDIEVAHELIARGIDVDITNDYEFTSLHVAMMNDSTEMVQILLDAGADATDCLAFMTKVDVDEEVEKLLTDWAEKNDVAVELAGETPGNDITLSNGASYLYFTCGSLKRGFPEHEKHKEVLKEFVGTGVTRQAMPLIVPKKPECSGSNGSRKFRAAALVGLKGRGHRIKGEVFRVDESGLKVLDGLEGYFGPLNGDNVNERKTISVMIEGKPTTAFAYVAAEPASHLAALDEGISEAVSEYSLDMAT